ncbi:MAG: ABC transporter ATP-binding protein [Rhodobacteraceae bacterium]|nr:ABC transporter ATP-binding protein [Paracoccaceae bacterium]MXZ50018.1 ABC transporter ATP-binding protein [Paracoccaceae bacterium]MYF46645.1 ABC transporter ATP-binding protein [Paracoccaceae bacterium]MYG10421.1 ABC transporter ATP-binding protein [Paracoccaceae bacterium]MYI91405.1 ABC transporter ATP-binding protein [Paracoccaceae bacterium]
MDTKVQHDSAAPMIELRGISKSFGPVQANKNINLKVNKGSIHGIVGENGAGKSTLMSILYGFYKSDSGEIYINGKHINITDSHVAIEAGIGMVHQHFKLVENFTVLENVILGTENSFLINPALNNARVLLSDLASTYSLEVNPDALIEDLSVGHQQRVEILKALYRQADILILDEPTGVLTPAEADHLFNILRNLSKEGKTIILITHKLKEIMSVTDTVSVMRRGEMTATLETSKTNPQELAELMVGRSVLLRVEKDTTEVGDKSLEVHDLSVTDKRGVTALKNVSFHVRKGEILGIAGVAGNGQTELLEALGGISPATGTMKIDGEEIPLLGKGSDARSKREYGVSHVPEDRQKLGLILDFFAWENIAFGYHHKDEFNRNWLLMDNGKTREIAREEMAKFDIRPPTPNNLVKNFSGGNQQKIVLARELEQHPKVLIVGQPTRGVDIGAIEFIHQKIIDLRNKGVAILLVSVELDEIFSLSDRVAVLFDGKIIGERITEETNESELGLLMAGIEDGSGEQPVMESVA